MRKSGLLLKNGLNGKDWPKLEHFGKENRDLRINHTLVLRFRNSGIGLRFIVNGFYGRTQLLLSPTLNVAFKSFKPQIGEPFPNEQLLRKKKIVNGRSIDRPN